MGKLKTLNDIKGIWSNGNNELGELHIHHDDLREEAIKWIKELEQSCSNNNPVKCLMSAGKIEFIRQFFNITDADLEEGDE